MAAMGDNMNDPAAVSGELPIREMRIRFWGVQGSCPLFPESYEVAEYKRMVISDVLKRVMADIQRHTNHGTGCQVDDLLGGPLNEQRLQTYQDFLNLEDLPVYGGDTTCVSVENPEGDLIVLDGGSGIRNCSKFFMQHWPAGKPRQVHLLGTHEHLDHRSGLPFSQFCYVRPPFDFHIYGGYQFLRALDERYGIFSKKIGATTHLDDPIDYRAMVATFHGHELRNSSRTDFADAPASVPWEIHDANVPLHIGKMKVTTFDVYHGTVRCLAYKIQHGSATFVFCTDHEVRHGIDADDPRQGESARGESRFCAQCMDADAVYVDGQYFRAEYDGLKGIGSTMAVSRVDWGHGCIEDIIERSRACRIKRTFIGHHDPERTWVARLQLDRWLQEQCKGKPNKIELAKSEDTLDL
jgi:hypothetical protein